MTCSQCINIALSGSSLNRRSCSLRTATVCKAKPLCFCRPCRGWGDLTMLFILSTLLPQMTVSVASRLVAESRDWPYTQTHTPAAAPSPAQAMKYTAIRKSSCCLHLQQCNYGSAEESQPGLSIHLNQSERHCRDEVVMLTILWYSLWAAPVKSWWIDNQLLGTIIDQQCFF